MSRKHHVRGARKRRSEVRTTHPLQRYLNAGCTLESAEALSNAGVSHLDARRTFREGTIASLYTDGTITLKEACAVLGALTGKTYNVLDDDEEATDGEDA